MNEILKTGEFYFLKIRKELIKMALIFAVGFIFGVIFYQKILKIIFSVFNLGQTALVFTSPGEAISLILSVGFFSGVLISFPLLIYEFLKFIKPALTEKEYRLLNSLVLPGFFLLLLGLVYGFYIMRFVALFYSSISFGIKVEKLWNVSEFLAQMLFLSTAMGILFQLPVVLTVCLKSGFLKKQQLVFKRKEIYAFLLILAVFLPPTDPLSLLILVSPLLAMFEGVLLFNKERG